jgi:DNA-binding MarR family transcriptional regulator
VGRERARKSASDPARESRGDQRWEDLADLVLMIAREIQFRGYADPQAIALTPSEGMVMRHLVQNPEAPPSGIAAATGLQRTNLSTVLRSLERKGLIERGVRPDDRRGVTVHATESGKTNYARVRKEWGAAVSAAAADNPSGLDAALRLLGRIEKGLVDNRPQ